MFFLFLFTGLLLAAHGRAEDNNEEDAVYKDAWQFVNECGSRSISLCFKERALRYVDSLPNNLDLHGAIRIKENDPGRSSRQHNPLILPEEPSAREEALTRALLEKIADYLGSHTFELKVPTETVRDMKESVVEARKKQGGGGGGKKGGGGMMLMMLMSMKAAMIGALALKAIGLVAFKALVVAKVALTIASIIALKKLFSSHHHTSSYEVVAHPHYDDHGHYDRSFSQEMAYSGYKSGSS